MELCAYWTSERYISLLPPSIHLLLLAGWATRRKRTVQWPRLISHPHSACAHGRCATHRRHPPPTQTPFSSHPERLVSFFLFLSVSPAAALALSSLHFLLESTLHVIPIPPLSEESGRVWRLLFLYFGTNSIFHPPPDLKLGRRRRRHHGIERVLLPYEFVHYYKTGDPLLSLSLNRI